MRGSIDLEAYYTLITALKAYTVDMEAELINCIIGKKAAKRYLRIQYSTGHYTKLGERALITGSTGISCSRSCKRCEIYLFLHTRQVFTVYH